MALNNFRMLWDNRAFYAAILTATTEAPGYPVTNLQDPFRTRRYRSTSITGQSISIDLGASKDFNALPLVDHNLTFAATIRVTASDTPGGFDLLDETYDAWNPVIGFGEGYFGSFGFGGTIPIAEADRQWAVPNPIRIIYIVDENGEQQTITARYLTIEFIDAANPDGYIELGNLFPVQYADFGIQAQSIRHGVVDDSEINRSLGGQAWVSKKVPIRRTIGLTFDVLLYADKYWNLKFAMEKLGITENFIIDCFPSTDLPSQNIHSILYGRFQDLPEIEQSYDMGFAAGAGEAGRQVSATEITFEEEIT